MYIELYKKSDTKSFFYRVSLKCTPSEFVRQSFPTHHIYTAFNRSILDFLIYCSTILYAVYNMFYLCVGLKLISNIIILIFLGETTLKRIQIIDYVLAYITMDIDGSASAKEFVGYIL